MTTTRNFTINTRWGNTTTPTSTLHRHPKRNKPNETYLLDLLSQDILTEIDFLESGLEYHDKIKAVITKINPLYNPTIFAITQEI